MERLTLALLERIAETFDNCADETFSGAELARCFRGVAVGVAKNELAKEEGSTDGCS